MTSKEDIYKSYKTIMEMMEDRKFLNDKQLEFMNHFNVNELAAFCNKVIFNVDVAGKLRIVYIRNKAKKEEFKALLGEDFDMYLVVAIDKLSIIHTKIVAEMNEKGNIEVFDINNLLFNITKHELVPKHEVIKDETVISQLVEMYNIKTKYQLPIILKSDPVAKYYGLKSGNLVKVTRISPSAGEYILYRCCL
jgi:DNA-directed RNA polymerase subunit H (RpoH/RPB5)